MQIKVGKAVYKAMGFISLLNVDKTGLDLGQVVSNLCHERITNYAYQMVAV